MICLISIHSFLEGITRAIEKEKRTIDYDYPPLGRKTPLRLSPGAGHTWR